MRKFEKPCFKTATYDLKTNYGKFVIEPLERGFGTTLGNALRRVLLSSLPGASVYVETTGKKFVAFRSKRKYNVGVRSVKCGV